MFYSTQIYSNFKKYLPKQYVFGSRTYASYYPNVPRLLRKNIVLPSEFANIDVNNYFVTVTLESEADIARDYFVDKTTGNFSVYFKNRDGSNWSEASAVWFNYIVVINH